MSCAENVCQISSSYTAYNTRKEGKDGRGEQRRGEEGRGKEGREEQGRGEESRAEDVNMRIRKPG